MDNIIVLKNVHVIDGISSNIKENSSVLIKGNKIIYVGNYHSDLLKEHDLLKEDKNVEIINGNGMYLLPGLIDTHVHLGLDGTPDYLDIMIKEDPKLTTIKAVNRIEKILQSGFTTIRTMGDKGHIDIALKKAVKEKIVKGPRIIASGKAITITGGHGDLFPDNVSIEGIGRIADGPDEVRKAAREQLKLGADNIKLMATGGGMSPGPGTVSQLTIKEMEAAVQEAEKYNKCTGAHAIGTEGIINALKAGVRTIEHGTFLNREGIELFLEKDAFLVPTLAAFKTLKYGEDGGVPEYHLKKVQYFNTEHTANLQKAIKNGVKVIVGTDTGTPFNYHGESAYELKALVKNGLSEMEAIKAATSVAACALKLENVGKIVKGSLADIILVAANPLEDIGLLENIENIKMVIKDGDIIKKCF